MGEKPLRIGEVAQATGLTHRALRYYDELGLLKPASRMEGGHRLYSREDLQRLEMIKKMKGLLGFSLAETRKLIEAEERVALVKMEYQSTEDLQERREMLTRLVAIAEEQLRLIEQKTQQLQEFKGYWKRRVERCQELIAELEEKVVS